MIMRRIFSAAVLILAITGVSNRAEAILIASGQLSTADGTIDLFPIADFTWDPATLDWSVDLTAGLYTYTYVFSVPDSSREISHLMI